MTGGEVRGRHQERDRAEMLNEQEMEKNELFTKTHTVSQGIVSRIEQKPVISCHDLYNVQV